MFSTLFDVPKNDDLLVVTGYFSFFPVTSFCFFFKTSLGSSTSTDSPLVPPKLVFGKGGVLSLSVNESSNNFLEGSMSSASPRTTSFSDFSSLTFSMS